MLVAEAPVWKGVLDVIALPREVGVLVDVLGGGVVLDALAYGPVGGASLAVTIQRLGEVEAGDGDKGRRRVVWLLAIPVFVGVILPVLRGGQGSEERYESHLWERGN